MDYTKLLFALIFGIMILGFVSSQETENTGKSDLRVLKEEVYTDEGYLESGEYQLGVNQEIGGLVIDSDVDNNVVVASNVNFLKDKKESTITFNQKTGKLKLGDNVYENIKPQCGDVDEDNVDCVHNPTYIKLNEKGEVTKADFTTSDKGGYYTFNGTTIYAPADSRVTYDGKTGIKIIAIEGSRVEKMPENKDGRMVDITFEGKNINFPNNQKLLYGNIQILDSGILLEKDTNFVYGDLNVYSRNSEVVLLGEGKSIDSVSGKKGIVKKSNNQLILRNSGSENFFVASGYNNDNFFGTGENGFLGIEIGSGNSLEIANEGTEVIVSNTLISENVEPIKIYNEDAVFTLDSNGNIKLDQNEEFYSGDPYTPITITSTNSISPDKVTFSRVRISTNGDVTSSTLDLNNLEDKDKIVEDTINLYNERTSKINLQYQNSRLESLAQEVTPKVSAVETQRKLIQEYLLDGNFFNSESGSGKCIGNSICQVDGKDGPDMRAALTNANINYKEIFAEPGTEAYYEEILYRLEESPELKVKKIKSYINELAGNENEKIDTSLNGVDISTSSFLDKKFSSSDKFSNVDFYSEDLDYDKIITELEKEPEVQKAQVKEIQEYLVALGAFESETSGGSSCIGNARCQADGVRGFQTDVALSNAGIDKTKSYSEMISILREKLYKKEYVNADVVEIAQTQTDSTLYDIDSQVTDGGNPDADSSENPNIAQTQTSSSLHDIDSELTDGGNPDIDSSENPATSTSDESVSTIFDNLEDLIKKEGYEEAIKYAVKNAKGSLSNEQIAKAVLDSTPNTNPVYVISELSKAGIYQNDIIAAASDSGISPGVINAGIQKAEDEKIEETSSLTAEDFVENGLRLKRDGVGSSVLIDLFTRAIELDSGYGKAWGNRGLIYLKEKQYNEALSDFNTVVELDRMNPKAYIYRGDVYKETGKIEEMCADYRMACELDVCASLQIMQADNFCL